MFTFMYIVQKDTPMKITPNTERETDPIAPHRTLLQKLIAPRSCCSRTSTRFYTSGGSVRPHVSRHTITVINVHRRKSFIKTEEKEQSKRG
ncbi:hypothetical protein QQF64_012822 [Cirrhinus molitorella]|uniref:Uncharacterized protein n=1 Tax=Cirrhinus molitorella TaxID=172907 RepID=A0ABR3M067_9TELE